MPLPQNIKLALADDHTLFRKGLIGLIEMVGTEYEIIFEADNGIDLQNKIDSNILPDIILMDINMPGMDGYETVTWLNTNFPQVKVLVISMINEEESVIRMLKLGVKGYLSKDVEPMELKNALDAVYRKGFYYTDYITGKLVHTLQTGSDKAERENLLRLNERELKFIQFVCSELTYNEIAAKMFLSPKTIDGYRNSLFEKLQVKSRVGLALYAIKHGLAEL